jgi:hypothetical protein
LYKYDVVEVFLASNSRDWRHHYYEFELSPSGALFVANISNPDETCQGMSGTSLPCGNGLRWEARIGTGQWTGSLFIPWVLVQNNRLPPERVWRANFFRIDKLRQTNAFEYSCWNPTMASPPCFHRPEYFGELVLV